MSTVRRERLRGLRTALRWCDARPQWVLCLGADCFVDCLKLSTHNQSEHQPPPYAQVLAFPRETAVTTSFNVNSLWEQFAGQLAPHTHNVVASAPVCLPPCICANIRVLTLPSFNQQALIDTTPLPDDIPKVKELGASSAPLLSASFFIGARCKAYNDDYMMCKTEANGRGEFDCMKEGRKVTRCAASVYVPAEGSLLDLGC